MTSLPLSCVSQAARRSAITRSLGSDPGSFANSNSFNAGGVVPFAVLSPCHGSGKEWPFPTRTQPVRGALVGV
jgi:hypothetical protein